MASENWLQNADFRRSIYLIYYCSRLLILISSLPSRLAAFVGYRIAVSGFLRVGSDRIAARKVIVVDDKVVGIINADRDGAVGVIKGTEGVPYI